MYTVIKEIRGSKGYLINQPGIKQFAVTSGVDRGGFYSEAEGFNIHFRVAANDFISVSKKGVVTALGNVTGSLQVQMDQSANNFAMVADGKFVVLQHC